MPNRAASEDAGSSIRDLLKLRKDREATGVFPYGYKLLSVLAILLVLNVLILMNRVIADTVSASKTLDRNREAVIIKGLDVSLLGGTSV
ncbi:MAG: hypothetical protein L0Y56_22300, partial [Nitrospira sp.]|nr:hypothetical protein [Nitrospira sp.]